jgi:alkylation response protein AidB-like acyl-CoA dehydrogenase
VDLVLSEEQELLQRTARDYVSAQAPLKRLRQLRDANDADGFSRKTWEEMAQLGWVGILLPEQYGGSALGYMDLMVVMEEIGRGLAPEPMLSTVLLGANALLLGGSEAQKQEHLPVVAAGKRILSVASQEPRSRYDLNHVETKAEKSGNGWKLSGEKIQVLDGHVADLLIVPARTSGATADPQGITLFALRADTPGITLTRQSRVDNRNVALVKLDSVAASPDAIVGHLDRGGELLQRVVDRATIGLSAEMLGSMLAAFDMTLEYLKTRVQFGVLIGTFQALKHRAAKMYVETELARSAVMNAHRVLDEGRDDKAVARAAAIAKARCSDTFALVANEAVQMHGGIGMTDEHDVGFYLKRARAAEMTFGDGAFQRARLAAIDGY